MHIIRMSLLIFCRVSLQTTIFPNYPTQETAHNKNEISIAFRDRRLYILLARHFLQVELQVTNSNALTLTIHMVSSML